MSEDRRAEFEFIYRAVVKETESEAIRGRIFGNFLYAQKVTPPEGQSWVWGRAPISQVKHHSYTKNNYF